MNICIFGDSITWGGYDPKNGGWATMLRNQLEEKSNETNVYNLGICADDSAGLLKRIRVESIPRNPSIIMIAIGANDVKHQPNQPVVHETFNSNVKEIFKIAKDITSTVVVLGITPVDEKLTTPRNKPPYNFRENKDIDLCNQHLKNLAIENGFIFVSVPESFNKGDLMDGLHPNTEGHLKIYKNILPIIEKLII